MSVYDRLISICWSKCFSGGGSSGFLTAAEIRYFIAEIERFLGLDHLLTTQESELLRQLIATNQHMRLYREEAAQFLLRLVGCLAMQDFLLARSKLTERDLDRLVDAYPLDRGARLNNDAYRDLFRDPTRDRSVGTSTVPPVKTEPNEYTQKFKGPVEDSTWFQRVKNTTISFMPKSFRDLTIYGKDDNLVDPFYSKKFSEPLSDIKKEEPTSIRDRYGRSTRSNGRQQDEIRYLELDRERYEAEFGNSNTSRRLEELMRAIEDQNVIIDRLERRNRLNYAPSDGRFTFLSRLLRKTDIGLFSYPNMFLTIFVVFALAVLMLNVLKLVYFLLIMVYQNRQYVPFEEPYDDVVISFSWIQEIPWLEYAVYQFQEWAGY